MATIRPTRGHERDGALGQQGQRQGVGLQAPAPVLERHLQHGLEHAGGRIAHEEVEAVEVPAEFGEELLDALGVADVGLDRAGAPAHGPDPRADGLGLVVAIVVVDGHVAARRGQLVRDGPTDAPRRPGDHRDLPGQSVRHRSGLASPLVLVLFNWRLTRNRIRTVRE
jgi:hypothetical protein